MAEILMPELQEYLEHCAEDEEGEGLFPDWPQDEAFDQILQETEFIDFIVQNAKELKKQSKAMGECKHHTRLHLAINMWALGFNMGMDFERRRLEKSRLEDLIK